MNILQRFLGLGVRVRSHRAAKMALQSKRLSTCGGLAIALAAGWFVGAQPAFGAYSGSGVFTKISSRADLTVPGYYVIAYNTNTAMNCTNTAGYFTNTAINCGTAITNPATCLVWYIDTNSTYGGLSIYNELSSRYVAGKAANNAYAVPSVSGSTCVWSFAWASTVFQAGCVGASGRYLQYNASSPRFASYTGTQQHLTLYKMASTPAIAIADNGTVAAANVATGAVNQVLIKFSAAVSTANATLNALAFTTAGTYDANDLTNLKLWYSTDATLDTGSDSALSTISSPAAAGAKSFSSLSQTINNGSTGYFFITADVAGSADYGHAVSINAIANGDVTFAAGTVSGGPTSAGGAQTFVAAAPTSNGSVGSFTDVTSSGMTMNWTSGNGERRIVVVRSGSATSWTPSDGTTYAANADYASATDQGSGNKVCYDGTGTSFALSGLSAGTTYHVTVFEYNGTTTYATYYTAGTEASGSQATTAAGTGIYINPLSAGTPMATYYLGDTMGEWYFNFEIGQTWWDYAQVGIGTSPAGTDYNWGEAGWYQDGEGSNKRVRRNLSGYQYTSVGSHYVICQAKAYSGDAYTSKSGNGWSNSQAYPPADLSSAYFTCEALDNPTVGTVTATASAITLNWSQWNSKNVMVVRSADSSFTAPTGGQAYSANDTIGGDTVIYNGAGTSVEDSSRTAGTTYYYKLYSVNGNYYSAGASASKITIPATPGTITGDATVCSGASGETYAIDAVTGASGYTWTVPTGASITAGDGTTSITVTFGSTAGNVTVTADNASGSSATSTKAIMIATAPAQPGTITGNATVCSGASGETYSIDAVSGATGYTWGVPSGATITAGDGTTSITVTFGSSSGNVTVTADNDCGSGSARTLAVTIHSAPAAPAVSAETDVTTSGFTANWEAASGATEYRLDVMTSVGGSGTPLDIGGYDLLQYDSAQTYVIPSGTTIQPGGYVIICRNQDKAAFESAWGVALGANVTFINSGGSIPQLNGDETFLLRDASDVTVDGQTAVAVSGASTVQRTNATADATASASWTSTAAPANSTPGTGGVGDGTGGLVINEYSEHGTYTYEFVELYYDAPTSSPPTYVDGWEDVDVDNVTSYGVTGLIADSTYYYRVRAVNACGTSASSTAQEVTTPAGTATVVLDDNGTQVTAGNVGAGATARILHQFQLGVTAANATLTQVDFTTAGDYATADIANLKLRYSTDATLDAGDATLDTITGPAAAGAKAFDSLSQVINAASTGYFFITADIAASPTYGHSISVNAITTGGLTFTDASKSGETAAGGAQTIVANEPTSHATALLFTDVATTQMTVSWAKGGGENRIVVVKQGTSTSWTPEDGTAPDGVDADFSAATDQGSGNKIVYSGSGTNVTIAGLDMGTTYAVTVFEYNGTGTYVNYYIGGTPLSGTQMTDCPAAPTGLHADPTNQFEFTANWDGVSGAAGYVMDVSMTAFDAGGNGFQGFEATANDMLPYTLGGAAVRSTAAKRTGAYSLLFGTTAASVTFGPVTLSGTSASTVTVAFAANGPDDGEDLFMSVCTYAGGVLSSNVTKLVDGGSGTVVAFNATNASSPTTVSPNPYPAAVPATATQVYVIVWANGLESSDYYYVDDVSLTGPGVGYVNAYQARPVAGTSVSVTGLTDLVTYYWRVASTGPECTGDYSAVASVTTLPGPPPQPTGLTATDGTATEHVALSWNNDSAKETAFLVYRHTLDDFSGAAPLWTNAANATTYNDTTAAVGTRYYYWIVASNAIGISAASDSDSGYRKLATVTDLSASGCTDADQVALSWTDVAGDTGYGIWRDTDSDPAGGDWVGTASANATSYNDATATPGTRYYYWVRATNSTLAAQGDFHASGAAGVRQLAPVAVSASDDTDTGKVVVDWTDISGESGYTIWRSETDDTGTAEYLAHVDVTSYNDEEAVAGTTYHYWVRGTNGTSGCQSDWGAGDAGRRRLVENPSAATFTRDGREMVRAAITANAAANDILVLHSTAAEVTGTPALNSSYAVGDTLGNAKVIYKGAAGDFREHVVAAETTNHYRAFSVLSNAYYSSGIIPTGSPAETKPYQAGVIVETFSYTNVTLNADSITNKTGGANWAAASAWSLAQSGGASWIVLTNDAADGRPMFFTAASNMATLSGNRAFVDLDGASRSGTATRSIPATNQGAMYVSAIMAYRYEGESEGADRWQTIALMNGSTEEVEFGKVGGRWRKLDIFKGTAGGCNYDFNPYGASTDNWYWVVLKYDFDNNAAKLKAFHKGQDIPSTEPANWDLEWTSMSIDQVDGIRLKAGSGAQWLGGALFDEVRVSAVWPALLGEPDLVITPESEDFGNVEVGRADLQTFWVQNVGGDKVPMTVSSLTLGGTNPTNFLLSATTLGTIEYGQSNSFTVTFLPNVQNQAYSATLYLTNSSGVSPVLVSLAGYGIPSQLTNAPSIDAYEVGVTNQVTDAMVTSGVFSVVLDVYHPAGLDTATYDLLNGDSTVILADQTFESWVSANGEDYVLSNATHVGYWPGTPAADYLVRAVLISSNGYGVTNTAYASLGTTVESDDLFISEYIEGSSNNKAIEIYNGTGASVDLSDYALRIYANGGTSPSATISLSGTLAAGAVHVVANSSANAAILAQADLTSGSLTFNGNDVVALAKSGANIDVVGTIGSSANFGLDVTKIRKSSVTDGVTTYDTGEWTNYASDTTIYLGDHTMEGGGSGTPMQFQVVDDDTDAPVIASPLVNGATTPATAANGPSIAIGDVPGGGFDLDWDIQDAGSGVFAASNHYTLKRSNAVVSAGAVTAGSDGDGKGAALAVSTTLAKTNMIWGNYVLSLAGADYDPEWSGDVASVSNVFYFAIAAPSIGLSTNALDFGTTERDVASNLTVVVTNAGNADLAVSSIAFSGTGAGYFSVSPETPTIAAGSTGTLTVTFLPTAGGTFNATMTIHNNTPNNAAPTVAITAECYDPETAPPTFLDFWAKDSMEVTNEVTDHAMANGGMAVGFTLWHYAGMAAAGASYDLFAPDGTQVWTNGAFDAMAAAELGGKTCQVYTAAVPGFYPAVLGSYTARVTAVSSNGCGVTNEATFTPATAGQAAKMSLDDFDRADAVDAIGEGWMPVIVGPTNGNVQIADQALQFFGKGGAGGENGRLSVARDMGTTRYQTVLSGNRQTLTWGFNFLPGYNLASGNLGGGSYAGAFVLGSDSTNWVNGVGKGYAVLMRSNAVALVRFAGGLTANTNVTILGSAAAVPATNAIAVRVDLNPTNGVWTLYVKQWGGTTPAAFGDPIDDMGASLVGTASNTTHLGTNNLKYAGCYWNHGSTTNVGDATRAVFDDVFAPYVIPAALPAAFVVVDEDLDEPVHGGFNVNGRSFAQSNLLSGLTVTGLVSDASGVYAGASNVWTLYDSEMNALASGAMAMTPDTDGAGTIGSPARLTTVLTNGFISAVGTYHFRLVSADHDVDRPGDSLRATNTYTFYVIEAAAPTPLWATAEKDGMEMMLLGWDKNGATDVVVLWSSDSNAILGANSLLPAEAYPTGSDGPNGTKVVYRGGDADGVELVVGEYSANFYRVFGANVQNYSEGFADPTNWPAMTLEYEDGEIADQFAYTNSVYAVGVTNFVYVGGQAATGQGWGGPWEGDTDKYFIEDGSLPTGISGYPDPYANKLKWIDTSSFTAETALLTRPLALPSSSRMFVAFMLNYQYSGTGKFMGVSLMSTGAASNDTEEIFFGKLNGHDRIAGIDDPGVATTTSSYDLDPGHGNDYVVIGELDPAQKTARMWAYATNAMIPQEYTNALAGAIATYSNASLSVGTITGIRLGAGSEGTDGTWSNELGHLVFDEVRVGSTWDEVLNFNFPKAYNFSAGVSVDGTNYVTDGELAEAGKSYPVSYQLYHRTGVTNAYFTIITNTANLTGLYPTNLPLVLNPLDATDQYRAFTNMVTNRLDSEDVALGVYTSRVWMTAVSGKATNTLFMEGMAGATELFFGEFGEGDYYNKYVEIYNGTGGSVDLSRYFIAKQTYGDGIYPDYSKPWTNLCHLASSATYLPHGETIVVLNNGPNGAVNPGMTNALAALGVSYLLTTNDVLNVSGNDPVGLFKDGDALHWVDMCAIAPDAGTGARYIMRRLEDAEVPLSHPTTVMTNQWDYRDWCLDGAKDSDAVPAWSNFTATAGVYDRNVGLGGYITFTVIDDDPTPPEVGTNSAVLMGTGPTYAALGKEDGQHEVVLTAWSFTNNASVEAALRPWPRSLLTNAFITCAPAYTNVLVDLSNTGTGLNDVFDTYSQINQGALELSGIGAYGFGETNVPWVQFEFALVAADDITLSWAEQGGANSFTNVSVQWSPTGVEGSFATNAAWPPWTMTDATEWRARYLTLSDVAGISGASKVYLRFVLGPGYGGASGAFRMDNIQLIGRPDEYVVTDSQLVASGNALRFRGNVYDTNSGVSAASSVMRVSAKAGTRDETWTGLGDGKTNGSTLKWDLALSAAEITDFVLESEAGSGLPISVSISDADADRADDALTLDGQFGHLRVVDDDSARPRLTLETMRPRTGVLAQWRFTNMVSLLATRTEAGVSADKILTATLNGALTTPKWNTNAIGGIYAVRQSGWQAGTKYWYVDVTPDADAGITNVSFYSQINKTNGPTQYYVRHYVNGSSNASWGPFSIPGNDTGTWYLCAQGFSGSPIALTPGADNQIRIHGMGAASNSIGTYWSVHSLTFQQGGGGDDSITEVTDEEFATGSFQLLGAAWDSGSGLVSATNATTAKRPQFSLNKPDGGAYVADQLLAFTNAVADGGATNEAAGGFANALPQPGYTNVLMGEYAGSVGAWDRDGDRTSDDLQIAADVAMYVVDNDNGAPSAVGTVRVNGQPVGAPDRNTAPWTNQPEFIVSFDSVAVDQDPGASYGAKQRALSGIGEYRVTTTDVSAMAASNRAALGTPYPVATTNGALANYGFEMNGAGWTLDANCSYQTLAAGGTNLVKEGTNSLRQANGGVAFQTIEFRNLAGVAPHVGVSGWYRSETTPTFRVEAFRTNDLAAPVATSNLVLAAASAWTRFSGPTGALGDGTVEVLKISLVDGTGNTTYWDDLRLHVDVGTNLPSMRFVATKESQGITTTNYLFAVDADNNRAADRLAGEVKPFYIAYDVTPPTAVALNRETGASTEFVDDPTTQFDVQWNPANVGPDDPGNVNHPTHVSSDRDVLSPWRSYKIYFGTYNSLDVPVDDNPTGSDGFIYSNFIANNAYRSWPSTQWNSPISDPSAGGTNYLAMTNPGQSKIRLFDLDYDQDYAVVVVGVDKAGNEGPAGITSWATNNTIKFALTRGWTLPKSEALAAFPSAGSLSRTNVNTAAGLAWLAAGLQTNGVYTAVTKDYDLIYMDAPTFRESTNNVWLLVGTNSVRTNWFVDDGAQQRPPRGNLRFYRASYKDRWKTSRKAVINNVTSDVPQRPIASEEIYAVNSLILSEGQNFVSFHGVPYTNTFEGVFGGTECFPGGSGASSGTRIEFFKAGTNALLAVSYWLDSTGAWWRVASGTNEAANVTTAPQAPDFFTRGFSITLPPLPANYATTNAWENIYRTSTIPAMVWSPIAQVPTNTVFSQVIHGGSRTAKVYNVVALRLPVAAHPSEMNLLSCGFANGTPASSDEIYTMDTTTKNPLSGTTIYCDTNNTWRFLSGGLVPRGYFKPNDVIVIVSKNGEGSTWTWHYQPTDFYTLPTRWMGF